MWDLLHVPWMLQYMLFLSVLRLRSGHRYTVSLLTSISSTLLTLNVSEVRAQLSLLSPTILPLLQEPEIQHPRYVRLSVDTVLKKLQSQYYWQRELG